MARPHKVFTYLNDEEMQQLQELAEEQAGSVAAALRRAMVREHKRLKQEQGDA